MKNSLLYFKESFNFDHDKIKIKIKSEPNKDKFLIYYNRELIGYALVQFNLDKNFYWLTGLILNKNYRKVGIGSKVLNFITHRYNKPLMVKAFPYDDEIDADTLIKFYLKNGFRPYKNNLKGYLVYDKF